jgi:hypothetical protein
MSGYLSNRDSAAVEIEPYATTMMRWKSSEDLRANAEAGERLLGGRTTACRKRGKLC